MNKDNKDIPSVADKMQILFQSKVNSKRTWTAFASKERMERLLWISKRKPLACTMMDMKTQKEFYYPELDGIIVHLSKKRTQYKSASKAYDVAVVIKDKLSNIK